MLERKSPDGEQRSHRLQHRHDTDQRTAPNVHYVIRPTIYPSSPEALPRPSPDHEARPGFIDNVNTSSYSKSPPGRRDERMTYAQSPVCLLSMKHRRRRSFSIGPSAPGGQSLTSNTVTARCSLLSALCSVLTIRLSSCSSPPPPASLSGQTSPCSPYSPFCWFMPCAPGILPPIVRWRFLFAAALPPGPEALPRPTTNTSRHQALA